MAKRVSLKGRGADLFFGDQTPPVPGATDTGDGQATPKPVREVSQPAPVEAVTPEPVAAESPGARSPRPSRSAAPESARSQPPQSFQEDDDAVIVQTEERTNGRSFARNVVRHSFDIRHDQLVALTQLQTARFLGSGRKPKLGEMVQEALDAYLRSQKKRTNERSSG